MIRRAPDKRFDELLDKIVKDERALRKLRPLSDLEQMQLDQARSLEHLYHSSRIEGTRVTNERVNSAIYGSEVTPAAH